MGRRPFPPVWAAAVALAGAGAPVEAQTFSAEVRPRFEVRAADDDTEAFTGMRTRVGVAWAFDLPGSLFVQVQDVRRWGTAPGDASADVFDLHQGWIEFGARGESTLWVRAGRQEMNFGTRRLIGAPPWSHASRSFDAARLAVRLGGTATLDAFTAQFAEDAGTGQGDAAFSGLWLEARRGALRRGAAYGLVESDGRAGARDRATVGGEALVALGRIELLVEGAVQDTEGVGEAAGFGAVRVALPLARPGARVSGGVDVLSGAAPGEDRRPFNRLYGLAHGFYGYADLFTDFDVDTGGRGLIDWTARGVWPLSGGWSVQVDVHRFEVAEDAGLGAAHLADELDLSTRWRSDDGVSLLGGLSFVAEGDALEAIGRPDLGQVFGYLQVGVALDGG